MGQLIGERLLMFHGAAKILTLLGVLLHAGMGCCAHHHHCLGSESVNSASEETRGQHFACSCEHHRNEQPAEDREEKTTNEQCPCGHNHDGCTDHCSWLTVAKVELPDNQCEMPLAVATCGMQRTAISQYKLSWMETSPLEPHYGKSLRASTQVWRL